MKLENVSFSDAMEAILLPPPLPAFDLSNYQRYFQVYDRWHDDKLGPEPTREALERAIQSCAREGRLLVEPLREALSTITDNTEAQR